MNVWADRQMKQDAPTSQSAHGASEFIRELASGAGFNQTPGLQTGAGLVHVVMSVVVDIHMNLVWLSMCIYVKS